MADDDKETPGMEEIESLEEAVLPTEKMKPTTPEREWQIKKLQGQFGITREAAEKMLEAAKRGDRGFDPSKGAH